MVDRRKIRSKVVAAIRSELMRGSNLELRRMKQAMAARLIELIQTAYMQKARGGRDVTGASWKPTKAFRKKVQLIMYRSGKIFRNFKFRITDVGFEIYNDVNYSEFAFKERPPWGDKIPDVWMADLMQVAKPFLANIAQRAIRGRFKKTSITAF